MKGGINGESVITASYYEMTVNEQTLKALVDRGSSVSTVMFRKM